LAQWYTGYDVLVTPVSPEPPTPLGELTAEGQGDPFALVMRVSGLITFTFPYNITGQPAVSLPLHWTADGLPVGVQLAAPTGREDVLIQVASQIEAAQPWSTRRPPISA
jgi:amidase